MHFKNLFMASLALNQFIHYLSNAENTIIKFENTSPDNTWILKSTGDSIDYMITHYHGELMPGEEETVEISSAKNFIYQVCDTSGQASVLYVNGPGSMCAVYSGAMMNITLTSFGVFAKAVENTAIKNITITGDTSPYMISATTLPPPQCDLPSPMHYDDGKWRIITLEGATTPEPQFPNACDLLYFAKAGVNTVRLPFKWDYLQCFLGQDIPINWAAGGYGAQIIKLTNAWTEKGYNVILSMYDRMRYSYCAIGASDCWVSQERFATAWSQIATQFVNNSRVTFGLMNNPDVYDIIEGDNNGTTIVLNNQNAAAHAIRATGASQLILYSGNGGSNIATWNDTFYGDSNANTFIPEHITDTHYQLDVDMFYEESDTLPEDGCIASAETNPQSCVDKQNPESFIKSMQESGIHFIIGKTGGTNSSACIICINQGTMWAMMQENITGIGMYVGGHVWMDFNGNVENSLYLAPIHNISQKQMTLGFQNVSNPKTGIRFLGETKSNAPSIMPTTKPKNSTATNYFSTALLCSYASAGGFLLALLYLIARYNNIKISSSIGKSWCGLFGRSDSLLRAAILNQRFETWNQEMDCVV